MPPAADSPADARKAAEAACLLPVFLAAPAPRFTLWVPYLYYTLCRWTLRKDLLVGVSSLSYPHLGWCMTLRNVKVTCLPHAGWCIAGNTVDGAHGHPKAASTRRLASPILPGGPGSSHLQLPTESPGPAWGKQSDTAHGVLQRLYRDLYCSQKTQ